MFIWNAKMARYLWGAVVVGGPSWGAPCAAAPSSDYVVGFFPQLYGKAKVEARFEGPVRNVSMAGWGTSQYPRG